jgi:TrwC relaxase
MSLHKLTAGAGYDYLTRQVAALDSTEKGHTGLASYYTERGETPGVWIGSGSEGIDGLTAGDPVTVEQMPALFGCGLHPLAELRQQQLEGPDLTQRDYQDAARLGAPFKIVDSDVSPFRLEVARRIAAINSAAGLRADAPLPAADRRGCGPRWPGSLSSPSMAASRSMPGSWRDRSRKTPGREHKQSPGMT